jgi:hypothetical protein
VAELVDAHGSGPCGRKLVEVQVLSSAYGRLATSALLTELDLDLRVHDAPNTEVRIELVTGRVDLDLARTAHDR